jgi:hypothetical protein
MTFDVLRGMPSVAALHGPENKPANDDWIVKLFLRFWPIVFVAAVAIALIGAAVYLRLYYNPGLLYPLGGVAITVGVLAWVRWGRWPQRRRKK